MTRLAIAVVLGAVVLGGAAGGARADSVPYADDGSLPWAEGIARTSPLETLAGQIASRISGRAVTVCCNGENDWNVLVRDRGVKPSRAPRPRASASRFGRRSA